MCEFLSGFYGILRPFDGISPYRLELQAKVRTDFCGNLYQFWGDSLANWLLREDPVIVNLASEEYAKAVRPYVREQGRFVTCLFAEEEQLGQLVEKGVYVKMARGEMARWAAERKAETPEEPGKLTGWGMYLTRSALRGTCICLPEQKSQARNAG